MNAPVAQPCRQRRLFARFASVCALVALALLLLPAVAHAGGYSMSQTYIGATVEADGSLTVVEGRQFDFDDDINGVYWDINTGSNQQGGSVVVNVLSVEEDDTAFNKVDSANKGDDGVYTVEQSDDGVKIKVFSPHESGDSAIYYLVYKKDVSKDVDSYIGNESKRASVLASMKSDEFSKYIDSLAEKLKYEENTSVIDKYKPELFFVAVEPTTSASTTSASDKSSK